MCLVWGFKVQSSTSRAKLVKARVYGSWRSIFFESFFDTAKPSPRETARTNIGTINKHDITKSSFLNSTISKAIIPSVKNPTHPLLLLWTTHTGAKKQTAGHRTHDAGRIIRPCYSPVILACFPPLPEHWPTVSTVDHFVISSNSPIICRTRAKICEI